MISLKVEGNPVAAVHDAGADGGGKGLVGVLRTDTVSSDGGVGIPDGPAAHHGIDLALAGKLKHRLVEQSQVVELQRTGLT